MQAHCANTSIEIKAFRSIYRELKCESLVGAGSGWKLKADISFGVKITIQSLYVFVCKIYYMDNIETFLCYSLTRHPLK